MTAELLAARDSWWLFVTFCDFLWLGDHALTWGEVIAILLPRVRWEGSLLLQLDQPSPSSRSLRISVKDTQWRNLHKKSLDMWITLWGVCMHLKRKHFVAWDQTWFFGPWFKGKESSLGKMLFLTSVYICPWTKRSTKHNIPKVFVKHTNVHQMAPNLSTLALVMAMLGRRLLLFAPWLNVARVGSESDLRFSFS